jgi:hypothetical protein
MINNSTNVNKKNNQFEPQTFWKQNKTTTNGVENLGSGLGQAQKCDGVKPVNGIPTLPS